MGQTNRYSRPAQVAKFNPLSAQEIMAVPLMKQEMEDQQIAANRDELKALYDTQAVGPDQERINAKKSDLEGRLRALSEDISTNGISRSKTKAFNTLKADYDREISLSGDIGHANAFVEKRDVAKQNFYNASLKAGWDKDRIDYYWNKHSATQSAFGADGTFNSEYRELGLPDYSDPVEQLLAEAKNFGYITVKDEDGKYIKTNTDAISNAIAELRRRYADTSTGEGRLAELEEWNSDDIYKRLELAGNSIRVWEENNEWNEKLILANAKAAQKAQTKALEAAAVAGENVWNVSPSVLKASGVQKNAKDTEKHFTALERNIAETREKVKTGAATQEELNALETEHVGLKEVYNQLENQYNKTSSGIQLQSNIALIENDNEITTAFFEGVNNGVTMKEVGDSYMITAFKYTESEDGETKKQIWKDVYVSKDIYNNRERAKKQYEDGLYAMIGQDNSHFQDKEYIFTGQNSDVKATRNAGKKFKDTLIGMFKAGSSEINFLQVGNLEKGEKNLLKSVTGEDAVKEQKQLMNIMSHLSDKIELVSELPGNAMHAPGVRVQIKIPVQEAGAKKVNNLYGEFAGQTLDIMVEINPDGQTSIGRSLMTQTIKGTTTDGHILAAANADYYEVGKFIPAQQDEHQYYNDDDIRGFMRVGSPTSKFLKKGDKIDLYRDEDTSKYKVKKLDSEGITHNLEYKDILSDMGNTIVEVNDFLLRNPMVVALVNERISGTEEFKKVPIAERDVYRMKAVLDLRESLEDVESNDYSSLLKLM